MAGVAQINLVGGQEREIKVSLDAVKLQGFGLSVPRYNKPFYLQLRFPLQAISRQEKQYNNSFVGKYKSRKELRNLVISSQNGAQIHV